MKTKCQHKNIDHFSNESVCADCNKTMTPTPRKATHTPTPWKAVLGNLYGMEGIWKIDALDEYGDRTYEVCCLSSIAKAEEDAALIVHRVNMFDELVEGMKKAERMAMNKEEGLRKFITNLIVRASSEEK